MRDLGSLLTGMVAMILALILIITIMSGCVWATPHTCLCPTEQTICEWRPVFRERGMFPREWQEFCTCRVQEICY